MDAQLETILNNFSNRKLPRILNSSAVDLNNLEKDNTYCKMVMQWYGIIVVLLFNSDDMQMKSVAITLTKQQAIDKLFSKSLIYEYSN